MHIIPNFLITKAHITRVHPKTHAPFVPSYSRVHNWSWSSLVYSKHRINNRADINEDRSSDRAGQNGSACVPADFGQAAISFLPYKRWWSAYVLILQSTYQWPSLWLLIVINLSLLEQRCLRGNLCALFIFMIMFSLVKFLFGIATTYNKNGSNTRNTQEM